MAISKDRFREALDYFYSKEVLFELYNKYFIDWIAEGYIGSNLGLFEVSLISENSNKQTFLDLMDQMYSKEEVFNTIFATLPDDVKEILEHLAWKGKYLVENIEEYTLKDGNYNVKKELRVEYKFFKYVETNKRKGYIYLHNDIVRMLRKLLPKPKEYYIKADKSKDYSYVKNSEEEIIEKFLLYYNFYNKGNLSLSSSNKLLKESKRNMYKYCDLDEYYKDSKDLDYLKTETIGLLFFMIREDYLTQETFRLENFKETIEKLLSGELIKDDGYHYTSLYLNFLKGLRNIWKNGENLKRCLESIGKVLAEMPNDGKVSIENIIKYLVYRDEFLEIVNPQDVYDYIYINEANYGRTRISNYEGYEGYIIEPFIKSMLFLLSSLGILEAYYTLPVASDGLYLKSGYLSKYDGLKYVSLTELGKYVLGRVDTYDFGCIKEEADIVLDEDRLILSIIGEAPIKSMTFEKMATKIAPNKFKFSMEGFLRGIESLEELKAKMEEFERAVGKDELPKLWAGFFTEIVEKSDSIKKESEIIVLKLKEDKELFGVIVKDEELKNLVLKAEGYYILLKEEDKEEVSEILKKYGYFVQI